MSEIFHLEHTIYVYTPSQQKGGFVSSFCVKTGNVELSATNPRYGLQYLTYQEAKETALAIRKKRGADFEYIAILGPGKIFPDPSPCIDTTPY